MLQLRMLRDVIKIKNKIDKFFSYILINYIHHLFLYVAVEDVKRRNVRKIANKFSLYIGRLYTSCCS